MAKKWIVCSIISACLLLSIGIWVGVHAEASRNQKQQEVSDSIQTTIAVVNQDMGALNHGIKENYSAAVIGKLGSDYVMASSQAAQAGYDSGTYGAIITFPSNLSAHVVSINEPEPEKVNLEFRVNPKLPEKEYIEVYNKIIDLQYEVNQMLSYMYVYSIYEEMHDAQDKVGMLFQNDTDDMEAANQVKLYNFMEKLNFGDIPNPPFEPARMQFDTFVSQVDQYAQYMANVYLSSYDLATKDYITFEDRLVTLVDVIGTESSQWETDIGNWKNVSVQRMQDVENFKNDLLQWLGIARVWRTNNETWQSNLAGYQQSIEQYYTQVSGFITTVNNWRGSAQTWGNQIEFLQEQREQMVQDYVGKYIDNYEDLNTYKTALDAWATELQAYADSLEEEQEETTTEPEVEETTTEGSTEETTEYLETTQSEERTEPEITESEEITQEVTTAQAMETSTQPAPVKKGGGDNHPGQHQHVPELQLPPGFIMPAPLSELNLPDFDKPPCPSLDSVEEFEVSLPEPPMWGNDIVLDRFPEYEGEISFEDAPNIPEALKNSLAEISHDTPKFNPGNYLTEEVKAHADEYVSQYAEHLRSVKAELEGLQERNIGQLDQAYFSYNQYVGELRSDALSCHSAEQKRLQDGIGIFYNAKTATSKENRDLLGFFESMMPNSRINSVMNKEVVEFTVGPIDFVNTNIRTVQLKDDYAQEDLLRLVETMVLGFFIALCLFLLSLLFMYFVKKNRERKALLEEAAYRENAIMRQ